MPDNTHRIMRQILQLDFGPTDQFTELQQIAAQVWQNQGLATLETVLNRVAGPQERVQLDRLELDLGTLRGPDWPTQFSQRLAEQLERQLGAARQDSTAPVPATTTTPAADSSFEQFLYFCQQGRLPWWGRPSPADWIAELPKTLTAPQWQRLIDPVQRERRVRQRLIYTVSDDFLQTVLQRFGQLPEAARLQQQFSLAAWIPATQILWRERFWSIVLAHAPASTTAVGVTLMRQLLAARQQLWERDAAARPGPPVAHSSDRLQPAFPPDLPALPAPWQSWLDQAMQTSVSSSTPADEPRSDNRDRPPATSSDAASATSNRSSRSEPEDLSTPENPPRSRMTPDEFTAPEEVAEIAPEPASPADHSHPAPPWPSTEVPQPIADAAAPEDIRTPTPQTAEAISPFTGATPDGGEASIPDVGEEVYVDAAGLVILHPFLQELFQSLDLLRDHQFRDALAQRRAVALLTYLAFGDLPVPEYELLLPKLLVNWPWAEPLPPDDLTDAEQQTCDELLAAVLRHWSALRSSSPDWLREAFFWRDGKLTPVDNGWQLTLERQAQDVLLNRLPWGLGVIRLPWMTDYLYVNWIS